MVIERVLSLDGPRPDMLCTGHRKTPFYCHATKIRCARCLPESPETIERGYFWSGKGNNGAMDIRGANVVAISPPGDGIRHNSCVKARNVELAWAQGCLEATPGRLDTEDEVHIDRVPVD